MKTSSRPPWPPDQVRTSSKAGALTPRGGTLSQYLADNVLKLTGEAAEIVEVLARGAKGDAEATTRGGTKAARKADDEDYVPKLR